MKANYPIITLGVLIIVFAMLGVSSSNYLFVFLLYGSALIISGVYYKTNNIFFWLAFILTSPLIILGCIQFVKRLFYLIVYNGESLNGMGSPLGFLLGFVIELLFLITPILFICITLYRDFKKIRVNNFKI